MTEDVDLGSTEDGGGIGGGEVSICVASASATSMAACRGAPLLPSATMAAAVALPVLSLGRSGCGSSSSRAAPIRAAPAPATSEKPARSHVETTDGRSVGSPTSSSPSSSPVLVKSEPLPASGPTVCPLLPALPPRLAPPLPPARLVLVDAARPGTGVCALLCSESSTPRIGTKA